MAAQRDSGGRWCGLRDERGMGGSILIQRIHGFLSGRAAGGRNLIHGNEALLEGGKGTDPLVSEGN